MQSENVVAVEELCWQTPRMPVSLHSGTASLRSQFGACELDHNKWQLRRPLELNLTSPSMFTPRIDGAPDALAVTDNLPVLI